MDIAVLSKVVEELAALLPGAKVDKLVQGKEDSLSLGLYLQGSRFTLLLSADRSLPRLHLVSEKTTGTDVPTGFFLSLRKHLAGARLDTIGLLNEDRIVLLQFTQRGTTYQLIFELTGSSANLILAERSQRILAVLRPVPPGGHARALIPGVAYVLPGPKQRPDARPLMRLPEPDATGDGGSVSANRAVERLYADIIKERRTESLRRSLTSVVRRQLARADRKVSAVNGDLDSAGRYQEFRSYGELILARLPDMKKGQGMVDVTSSSGADISIPLDPSLTPAENADAYFRKYKKARAGHAIIAARLTRLREERDRLQRALGEIGTAPDEVALLGIRDDLLGPGVLAPPSRRGPPGRMQNPPPVRMIEHDGWIILVGKNAASNDHVTQRVAHRDDLWLHAEGMPGSHVLVRNPRRLEIPPGVLLKAAALAAYYSAGRNSAKVPVTYAAARFVKKPKGAKPGTVVLSTRKTVTVRPEPA